jgi:capsular polysaccharide biosynthesis protein
MSYLNIARRNLWFVPLFMMVAVAAGALLTARQKPLFRSSTMIVVTPSAELKDNGDVIRSLETLERRTVVATFARIPSRAETRADAADALQVNESDLRQYRISSSVVPNTNIIRIDVEGPHAETASAFANAAASVTAVEARKMYRIYNLSRLAEAIPANHPSFPDRRRNYLVALMVGLFLGVVTAVAIERIPADAPSRLTSYADGQ